MTVASVHHDGNPGDQEAGRQGGAKFSVCLSVACLSPMSDTLQYTLLSNGSVTSCVIYFVLDKSNIRREGLIWIHSLRVQSIMVGKS